MLFTASKYPKRNLDCSLTLQNSSQKKRLGFESDVYHFDTCPRLLGLNDLGFYLHTTCLLAVINNIFSKVFHADTFMLNKK